MTAPKAAHTPGPWIAGDDEDSDFFLVGPHDGDGIVYQPVVKLHNEANARRIVACVNACEQFEDPAEAIRLLGIEAAKAYPAERERDALRAEVARLREALRACLLRDDIADDELGDEIRAALGGGK